MRLLGAEVVGVEAGARTLKEAVSAAIRDWVANVGDTHYIIGSAVGPGARTRRSCATSSARSATRRARRCSRRPAGCPTA